MDISFFVGLGEGRRVEVPCLARMTAERSVSQGWSLLGQRGVSEITDFAFLTITNIFLSILSASRSDGPIKLFCRLLSAKYLPTSPRFPLCCAPVCAPGLVWAVGGRWGGGRLAQGLAGRGWSQSRGTQ